MFDPRSEDEIGPEASLALTGTTPRGGSISRNLARRLTRRLDVQPEAGDL